MTESMTESMTEFDQKTLDEINSLSTILCPSEIPSEIQDRCADCSGTNVKLFGGTYVCYDCYSQHESVVDDNAEWKHYGNDGATENPRCSLYINPLLPESSYNTGVKTDDALYNQRFKQLTKWQIPHHEKSLRHRLDDLRHYCWLSNLPGNVTEFAQQLYAEFIQLQPLHQKKKSSRGDCHLGIISVCISYACKDYGISRSPEDICSSVQIDIADYTKASNLFFAVMQYSDTINIAENSYVINPSDYINSFCEALGITDEITVQQIINVEKKVSQLNILQKNTPQAIAAGCIYFIAKMRNITLNKSAIDSNCKISIPTLTKVYDRLTEYSEELIEDIW